MWSVAWNLQGWSQFSKVLAGSLQPARLASNRYSVEEYLTEFIVFHDDGLESGESLIDRLGIPGCVLPVAPLDSIENRRLGPPEDRCQCGSFHLGRSLVAFEIAFQLKEGRIGADPEGGIDHPADERFVLESRATEELGKGR